MNKIKTTLLKKDCVKRLIDGLENPTSTFTGGQQIISSYDLESRDVEDLLLLLDEHYTAAEKKYKKTKKKEKS